MASENYFFPWQNPVLRDTIYPFREMKLRDFLLIYKEIDLWAHYKGKSLSEPSIAARLQAIADKARARREQIQTALKAAIEERLASDTWFARVTARDEKLLRFRRIYYLDRVINDQLQRQAELLSRQKALLRKVDWYPEGDSRRQTWRARAAELDPPLAAIEQELTSLRKVRDLYEEEDRLPKLDAQTPPTIADLARADLSEYEDALNAKSHDELVELVWQKLQERLPNGKPRFEPWFQYMIIHFSGMRYVSAHGSYADPNELLELLVRADVKESLKPGEDIDDKVEAKLQALLHTPINGAYKHLPPTLKALVAFKQEKQQAGDPLPDWVWQEITKFTQLRLGVEDPNWEAISPERWKYESSRWRELMDSWQRKDITQWRQKHKQTLELIVTRAVCNEIAEHIQHLRGNSPPGGLTSKPKFYLNLQNQTAALPEGDPRKCYFRRAARASDFVNGASIFWLGWTNKEPNAWQVAHPLPGIELLPGKRVVDGRVKDGPDWAVRGSGNALLRTRKPSVTIPSVQELRRRGLTDREIEQQRASLRAQNAVEKEYLRWKHEATVVEVAERIDGQYVLTFETGKIGLNWHRLENLIDSPIDGIFVGYMPKAEREPENLAKMLDEGRILRTAPPEPIAFEAPAVGLAMAAGPLDWEEAPQVVEPRFTFSDQRIRGARVASVALRHEWRLRKLRRKRRGKGKGKAQEREPSAPDEKRTPRQGKGSTPSSPSMQTPSDLEERIG